LKVGREREGTKVCKRGLKMRWCSCRSSRV